MNYQTVTIVTNDNDKVEVCQSRVIRMDDQFYMVPSQAYAGIDLGPVDVLSIGEPQDLAMNFDLGEDIKSDIEEFSELDLEAYDYGEEYDNRKRILEIGLWVVYKYTSNSKEVYVLPIEEFLDHSVRMV